MSATVSAGATGRRSLAYAASARPRSPAFALARTTASTCLASASSRRPAAAMSASIFSARRASPALFAEPTARMKPTYAAASSDAPRASSSSYSRHAVSLCLCAARRESSGRSDSGGGAAAALATAEVEADGATGKNCSPSSPRTSESCTTPRLPEQWRQPSNDRRVTRVRTSASARATVAIDVAPNRRKLLRVAAPVPAADDAVALDAAAAAALLA